MHEYNNKTLFLGQFLAILIAITASASTALVQNGISFPTLQSASVYLLLAVVYSFINFFQQQNAPPTPKNLFQYALMALLDVEANYVIVFAFRYTSITSVTLLDSWSIPMAMVLTKLFGLAIYKTGHYGGAALCILGLAVLVAGDQFASSHVAFDSGAKAASSPAPFLGDMLVLLGASLYASCNVMQEYLLSDSSVPELLSFLGLFGFALSATQGTLLELHSALQATWQLSSILPMLAFIAAMFAFYSLVPLQLELGGASMLNICLLSSDLWSALMRVVFFGGFSIVAGIAFLISLVLVAGGIWLYSASGDAKHAVQGIMPRYIPLNVSNNQQNMVYSNNNSDRDRNIFASSSNGEGSAVYSGDGLPGDNNDDINRNMIRTTSSLYSKNDGIEVQLSTSPSS